MDSGERGLGFSVRSQEPAGRAGKAGQPPLETALLFVVALWLFMEACRVVTHTSAASRPEPPLAAATVAAVKRESAASEGADLCGLVKRAGRTWVGLGEGLGPADLVTAAFAAAAAVRALDGRLCASLERGELVPELIPQRNLLMSSRGGGFEVDRIQLSGSTISRASLRMHAKIPADPTQEWAAELIRNRELWTLADLSVAPRLPPP
jgi:hypothetical protein